MIKRAVLFCIVGALTGDFLGAVAVGALLQSGSDVSQRAVLLRGILGVIHGFVLFFCSLGDTPVIEYMRAGRFVSSDLADRFGYRRFGHRTPYIAVAFGLAVAFVVAPLLVQDSSVELRSVGIRLFAGPFTVFSLDRRLNACQHSN